MTKKVTVDGGPADGMVLDVRSDVAEVAVSVMREPHPFALPEEDPGIRRVVCQLERRSGRRWFAVWPVQS